MVSPEHPLRKTIGEAFSHVVTESTVEGLGLRGARQIAQREWDAHKTKGFRNRLYAARKAGEGALVGAAAQWTLPATYKALAHSETFLEQMRFLPGLALDTVNLMASVSFFAASGFNLLALAAFKSGINALENALVDGAGHVAEKAHGATVGRLRRVKR